MLFGVTPAAASGVPADCVEPAGAPAHAKVKHGAAVPHDPNELTDAEVAQREQDFNARRANTMGPFGATVNIQVIVHVIREDTTRAGGDVPRRMIEEQIYVLNQAFAGDTGGARTVFRFTLKEINRVTNPDWYPIIYGSQAEKDMKRALRKGGDGTLNLYTGLLSGRVASGRDGRAVQPRRHGHPRSRALAEPLPHVPGQVRRAGRPDR
jgi:hypothetical protein